jgi:hypothetical protein
VDVAIAILREQAGCHYEARLIDALETIVSLGVYEESRVDANVA